MKIFLVCLSGGDGTGGAVSTSQTGEIWHDTQSILFIYQRQTSRTLENLHFRWSHSGNLNVSPWNRKMRRYWGKFISSNLSESCTTPTSSYTLLCWYSMASKEKRSKFFLCLHQVLKLCTSPGIFLSSSSWQTTWIRSEEPWALPWRTSPGWRLGRPAQRPGVSIRYWSRRGFSPGPSSTVWTTCPRCPASPLVPGQIYQVRVGVWKCSSRDKRPPPEWFSLYHHEMLALRVSPMLCVEKCPTGWTRCPTLPWTPCWCPG